eukprot:scaffold107122_cov13-Tisochrysis_lutea.AAC.1
MSNAKCAALVLPGDTEVRVFWCAVSAAQEIKPSLTYWYEVFTHMDLSGGFTSVLTCSMKRKESYQSMGLEWLCT